jgi:hypothetical protein
MAPRELPSSQKRKSAKYYEENPEARKKKNATTSKNNKKPEQRAKRTELKQARRDRGMDGKGGKDLSHTKDGKLVKEDPSTNRARNRGKK